MSSITRTYTWAKQEDMVSQSSRQFDDLISYWNQHNFGILPFDSPDILKIMHGGNATLTFTSDNRVALGPIMPDTITNINEMFIISRASTVATGNTDLTILDTNGTTGGARLNVQSGTTVPGTLVHVAATGQTATGNAWSGGVALAGLAYLQTESASNWAILTDCQQHYLRTSTGSIDYHWYRNTTESAHLTDGHFLLENGSAAHPAHSYISDTTTGTYWISGPALGLAVGGVEIVDISSGQVVPIGASTGTVNLGNSTWYWADVSYKTLTDRGCLPWCDDGVELLDGSIVSDTEAILSIKKHPQDMTIQGLPKLDYRTFPKKSYKPACDRNGKVFPRDENDKPIGGEDGVEMTMLFGVMIGAIKELTQRIKVLEEK